MKDKTLREITTLVLVSVTALLPVRSAGAQVLLDDFNGTALDSVLWTPNLHGTGPVLQVAGGQLVMTLPAVSQNDPESGFFWARANSKFGLRGDFDVRVSYALLEWPPASGARIGLGTVQHGFVERSYLGSASIDFPGQPSRDNYVTDFGGGLPGIVGWTATTDHAGGLRLTRAGAVIRSYYLGSTGWVEDASEVGSTDDTWVTLMAWSDHAYFAGQEVQVAFDSMRVTAGTVLAVHDGATERPALTVTSSPNPFRGSAHLGFTIATLGQVHLDIFDTMGRRVAMLVDGVLEAGRHEVDWRPGGLHPGVYLARLQSRDRTAVSRLMLIN